MEHKLEEVAAKYADYRQAMFRVALPGQVVSYDPTTQTADIQPMIQSHIPLDDGALVEDLGTLASVPVCFAAGGGFAVMVPLQPGDPGTLIFNDFSMDAWRSSPPSAVAFPPQDLRTHALGNAEFWPGKHPDTKPLVGASATDLVVALNGLPVIDIDPTGQVAIGEMASDYVALATNTESRLAALEDGLTKLQKDYLTHMNGAYPYVPSVPPQVPLVLNTPPTPVKATSVKAI